MKRSDLKFSKYQIEIFKEVQKGISDIIVEARAGAAKSSTILESFRFVPRGKKVIVLAFNKIIQKEMREKAPSYIQEVLTFHSLGYRAIKQRFGDVSLDNYKVFNIAKEMPECKDNKEWNSDLIQNICDTVSYCKYGLLDTPKAIDNLISRFGIDTCDLEREDFIRLVIQILGKNKVMTSCIDYNDMCYFPYIYNLPLPSFDLVFIDERQDINASQNYIAKKVCKKDGGRIIAVGDSKQDLYSWRLSDNSLIEELKQKEGTKILFLPISYRCPKKVVELVKPWVPDFTCPETAKEGSIEDISLNQMFQLAKQGCFILSRTNAPLIKICLSFIRNNQPCRIKGKDIAKQLTSIIKKSKKKQVPAFLKWLEKYKKEETEKLIKQGIGAESFKDRCECLENLCDEFKNLDEVRAKIDELFNDTDEKKVIVCGSVHSCKGLERDEVFLLCWTFGQWFDQIFPGDENEFNEELNISYVACSRTRDKLYLVHKIV